MSFVYFHNMDEDRESLLLTVLSPDYDPCPEQADDTHLNGQAEESDTVYFVGSFLQSFNDMVQFLVAFCNTKDS